MTAANKIEELVQAVRNTAKYAAIDLDLVTRLVQQELKKRRSDKETIKAVRSKLHQIGGAYLEKPIDYAQWMDQVAKLPPDLGHEDTKKFCRQSMLAHTSTRERLPYLEDLLQTCLNPLGPLRSLSDLACGLNPLSLPWLFLAKGATIQAIDIYHDQAEFLNAFFAHVGICGEASIVDLTTQAPTQPVQVALLFKALPCLEQLDKNTGRRLLTEIKAEHLLVSFPAHSLGGRGKGMRQNYEAHFNDLIHDLPFQVQRFDFPGELVFRLSRT